MKRCGGILKILYMMAYSGDVMAAVTGDLVALWKFGGPRRDMDMWLQL